MPMKPEPSFESYYELWAQAYDDSNYDQGLAARLMKLGHRALEARFSQQDHFAKVLEVGAGSGAHFPFVRHRFDEYLLTDGSDLILQKAKQRLGEPAGVRFLREDAANLSFGDGSFDRVLATHVLEHLPDPHLILREWARVLKPGGTLSLLQPCDPGIAWRFGRMFGPRSSAERVGLPYDYWMAREHINPVLNIVHLLRYYFDTVEEQWLPLRVPSSDLNLFYICHVKV